MFCRRCGAALPEGAAFCPHCQEPVLPPGMPTAMPSSPLSTGISPAGLQPPSQPQPPAGVPSSPLAGQWYPPTQAGPPLPPAGEQFSPPPPWAPAAGQAHWPAPGAPGTPAQPPPPPKPLLEPLFGPTPPPGSVLTQRNGVQQRFLSRLQPTTAGSAWFGALAGALVSLVIGGLLALICSLLLGGILDQAFASTAAALSLFSRSSSSQGISFFSNPLVLFDYAQRSAFTLKVGINLSGSGVNASASITPPITLLLLVPAIALTLGGYFAASTDYTGRRLFRITRGASISLVYALLALLLSFFTSVDLASSSSATSSATLTLAPDPTSVFLTSLFWGIVFGALGGELRARELPPAPTRAPSRRDIRLRAALLGARFSLGTFFAICLALVLALYLLAQIGGPTLQTEGSPVRTGSAAASPCHVFIQQPATAAPSTLSTGTGSGASGPVWFLVDSPPLAVWLMSIALGAPLQISGDGLAASLNTSIGLIGADCSPGAQGAFLYLLLIIPAIAIFLGGRRAARRSHDATPKEAASTGFLLAGILALAMLLLAFLASITFSVLGLGINFGPSLLGTFIATLLFGLLAGIPGAIVGRSGAPPQPAPLAYAAWPMAPGAAYPAGQAPPQPPSVSVAVSSLHLDAAQMPAGADIWHAPTQPPGSGGLSEAPTQASNSGNMPGPNPPGPANP